MPIINSYYTDYDTATTTSATSDWYTIIDNTYRNSYINEPHIPAKPKKKTFEEKLQSEIDHWLSEFD